MCPAVEVEVTRVISLLKEDSIARLVALVGEVVQPNWLSASPRKPNSTTWRSIGSTLVVQSTLRPPWSRAYLGAGLGPSHILSLDDAHGRYQESN